MGVPPPAPFAENSSKLFNIWTFLLVRGAHLHTIEYWSRARLCSTEDGSPQEEGEGAPGSADGNADEVNDSMEAARLMFVQPLKQKQKATRIREFNDRELTLNKRLKEVQDKKEMYKYALNATINEISRNKRILKTIQEDPA